MGKECTVEKDVIFERKRTFLSSFNDTCSSNIARTEKCFLSEVTSSLNRNFYFRHTL